jgi:hypothetical protein
MGASGVGADSCVAPANARFKGAAGTAPKCSVLAWQIGQCAGSWAAGHLAPPGASMWGTVGACTPGSNAGHTANAHTCTSSTTVLPARRRNDERDNTDRV